MLLHVDSPVSFVGLTLDLHAAAPVNLATAHLFTRGHVLNDAQLGAAAGAA
jgi:hypothetical protein